VHHVPSWSCSFVGLVSLDVLVTVLGRQPLPIAIAAS